MLVSSLLSLLMLVCVSFCATFTKGKNVDDGDYKLIWSEEFDGPDLDESKWNYHVGPAWGDEKLEYYTARPENVHIKDGKLVITAIKEDYEEKKYTSGRVDTKDKGDWLYGKVKVRAKLPPGMGTHTGIWMYSTENKYGPSFRSGEIDIMEVVGVHPYRVYGTIHCQAFNSVNHTQKYGTINNEKVYSDFHDYSVIWDEEGIAFFMDEELFFTYAPEDKEDVREWPFKELFYVILSQSVAGWGGVPDDDAYPSVMLIDSVHIYAKN